jgi:effector-binding domain-containing protein
MNVEIATDLHLTIFGFGGEAIGKRHVEKVFQLMDNMWKVVKTNELKNKGKNIWVYDGQEVFAGVELESQPPNNLLERKEIHLPKFARYKHIGPYNLISQSGQSMTSELQQQGFEIISPYIEIYGHWDKDDSKLETDLLMTLK